VGSYEAVLSDSTRIAAAAKAAGVAVRIDEFPEMQHCFELLAGSAPEADEAVRRIAAWLRPLFGIQR
jgi:acetyl esterase/lipase